MLKKFLPFLLYAGLFIACEARRKTTEKPTEAREEATDLDTAHLVIPDSLTTNSAADTITNRQPNFFMIQSRQVGPIKINMPVSELKEVIPPNLLKEVQITREGRGNKAYEIRKNATDAQPALRVEETCKPTCLVWRVQVLDSAYKMTEGIGIGATLGDIKKYYPISFLGPGETEIVAVSATQNITFMLDVSKLPTKQVPFLNLKNTPDQVRILGILIF